MKALLQCLPNRVLLLLSIIFTIPHIVSFLDSTFPATMCKNHAFLDPARNRNILYLGSFYSAAISTWALSAKHSDLFSNHHGPPEQNGVSVRAKTSTAVATEQTRYLCVLKMVLLAGITLAMDLSWAWYQGVIYAWSLPLVTEIGAFHKLMSMMIFPMCFLWITMMWMLGNIIPLMAFGNMMSLGFEAGVEQVARWDRSSRRLEHEKKEQ